jgi:shikimate dehydrogenase
VTLPPSRLVLLGHPTAHSLSPSFQNAALRYAGLAFEYVALDVTATDLAYTLYTLRHSNAAGNITIPHKTAAYALCDVLTDTAREVGAVNTFWYDQDALHGENTDVGGFNAAVRHLIGPTRKDLHISLLGAGGAASAVAAATRHWPNATLTIWNRTPAAAHTLAQRFDHARVNLNVAHAVTDADLVVNATPIGLYDDGLPVPISVLPSNTAVLDLVYRRGETPFVRAARAAGHPASDGLCMLIEQGALSFHLWFGITPNLDVMWQAATQ